MTTSLCAAQLHRYVIFAAATASLLAAPAAVHAECLGLTPPKPQQLNICRALVEDLLVPPVVTLDPTCGISGIECLALPHCCVPGVCLGFPECVVTKEVIKAAGYVAHAGDVYCGVQDIEPDQLISDLVNDRIPDPTTLASGGTNSVLYTIAGAYVDGLECSAKRLPDSFGGLAQVVMSWPGFDGKYADIDIDVDILPHRDSGVLDLPREGYDAITLGTLIFVQDDIYDTLFNVRWSYGELIGRHPVPMNDRAFFTIIHELVHARQYRELGREEFLNHYLRDALVNGYASVEFEEEAYSVSGHGDSWCEQSVAGFRMAAGNP
jgi:hypothetical protein